jgi:SAM-dependent methyltransferase
MTLEKISRFEQLFTGRLLDIGAGTKPYRSAFHHVSEYLGTNARSFYTGPLLVEVEALTDYWVEDATQLPLPEASVDAVVCFQVAAVIQEPNRLFREIHRVLRPEGRLMLTTDFLYPKWSDSDRYRYTDRCLREIAEACGFVVEHVESYGGFWSMAYCVLSRYVRDYRGLVRRRRTLAGRCLGTVVFGLMLATAPALSLLGRIIFEVEKHRRDDYVFTGNLMLVATKVGAAQSACARGG